MNQLIIFVGESGAGKTTFVKSMDCQDNWYESSYFLKKELRKIGKKITHDNIHKLANKKYKEDAYWQIPKIIKEIKKKKFLILDGPRRLSEVKKLLEIYPATLIVKIITSEEKRRKRLRKRDKINKKQHKKVIENENKETELSKILKLAKITIENNGSLEDIKKKAIDFKRLKISL